MAGYRRFSKKRMAELWEAYKVKCDHNTKVQTDFSQREGRHITSLVPSPISYTIKGFCSFIGLTEQGFYATYNRDPRFESVIVRMKEECEISARRLFETGEIPSQLSTLWMGNFGYGKDRTDEAHEDDGFLDAIRAEAEKVWQDD